MRPKAERRIEFLSFSALQRAEIAEIEEHIEPDCEQRERFSALQRAEIAEILGKVIHRRRQRVVSVLFNEPKLLKSDDARQREQRVEVSVLFNEPKLLKSRPPLPAPPVSQIPIPARRRS